MPGRAASPAPSEAEVDIFDALGGVDDNNVHPSRARGRLGGRNAEDGFAFLGGDEENTQDGDEAFIALQQAAAFRKNTNLKGKSVKKGGGFQAMGLNANLLRAITRKGYNVPTPIQRKTIPLILDRKDVVGMARTGSGKTAAFVLPMIERLKTHSPKVGARALILSPSRELALQTLKVVKEFGKGTDLKSVLLVGGDSLEEQFSFMTGNPDVVIATPGRFLHLKVEMGLSLASMEYVVFDEADRLFEMGFATQLTEILHALPLSRQTLLFSATLPASLVEFARAGLQEPSLVRLDAETKVSPDLESAFFTVKGAEKEAALLHILQDVIKMPTGAPEGAMPREEPGPKKRKRTNVNAQFQKPTEHSTIVFAATKHHVEYLGAVLRDQGYAVSYVYGSLDQTARKMQVDDFRSGRTNILVVTDVAARGIDIPVLANVINYDFPPQPKVFVHRVGRTARAGQRGWSYSIVRDSDAPYLIDLQLFLGKKLVLGQAAEAPSFANDIVVGALRRSDVDANVEGTNRLLNTNEDIEALRDVARKAEKLYMRTRNSASVSSAKRAKEVVASKGWSQLHPLFGKGDDGMEQARSDMLNRISGFKPNETIFEVKMGKKHAQSAGAEVMKSIRGMITPKSRLLERDDDESMDDIAPAQDETNDLEDDASAVEASDHDAEDMVSEDDEFEVTVTSHNPTSSTSKPAPSTSFQDSDIFMSYQPRSINAAEEKGYGVHSGGADNHNPASTSTFNEAARDATMDLTNDDGTKAFGVPARQKMRWDKRHSKYVAVANDTDGSKGSKYIRGESGVKIAASFQSGRFDKWRRANRLGKMPRVGDMESRGSMARPGTNGPGRFYKHKGETAPKDADKFRDDYHVRKKRVAEAKEKRVGRFRDGDGSRREVKGVEDIKRARKEKEKRREKNARPSKKARR